MKITRTFHPIGQGGFYTESFDDNVMVVYDCGGNSNKSMKDYIDSFLLDSPKADIEAVFISHLHDDHINGLQYLSKKARIKKIFLPQFTPNQLFNILFYNAAYGSNHEKNNDLVISLIQSELHTNDFGETSIIQIEEALEERGSYDEIPLSSYMSDKKVASGTSFMLENRWVYIPFNPQSRKPNIDAIENKYIRTELGEIYSIDDTYQQATEIVRFINSYNVDECKKMYKKLFGSIHNGQSMTLFSGLINPMLDIRVQSRIFSFPGYHHYYHSQYWSTDWNEYYADCVPTNFLYMGDYEASDLLYLKQLKEFYKKQNVWDTICGIQMPHHGSRKNYNGCLYKMRCYAIASAGSNNKYHHPNIDTLINVFQQGCMPFVVTEDKNTIIVQQFQF